MYLDAYVRAVRFVNIITPQYIYIFGSFRKVWICDDFESMEGSENLLYPDLDCHKQSHDYNNRSKTSEHPSFSERVASCTVLKEEIRTGVMSPNMQVLMLEQIHLSFKQALRLMSSELPNAAMVTLAQRAFFFQLAFTVTSLQRVFGDSYKHNDLMLGNIRSTYPQWLGSVVNGVKYAAGGRMAAPISNGKPLSYFKYQLDGKAYVHGKTKTQKMIETERERG